MFLSQASTEDAQMHKMRSRSFFFFFSYMKEMYNLDAFVTSCPADQDIISHYQVGVLKF